MHWDRIGLHGWDTVFGLRVLASLVNGLALYIPLIL
jgi:hypothetical protein